MKLYNVTEIVSCFNGNGWHKVDIRKYLSLSKEVLESALIKKDQKIKEYYHNKLIKPKSEYGRNEISYRVKDKKHVNDNEWLNDLIGKGDIHIAISWEEINVLTQDEIEVEEDNYYNSKLVKEIL